MVQFRVHRQERGADGLQEAGQSQRPLHSRDPRRHPGGGDRKSTRLNSSHANISYAVFCLKKKIISKLEIDLETLEFELEIALPSWALIDAEGIKSALRLEPNPHLRTSAETQPRNGRILGRFACSASGKPICFDCRRLRRAA